MDALRALYDRHRARIYQLGCRYLNDPSEAEDLVQQVFIKAYEGAAKFRGEGSRPAGHRLRRRMVCLRAWLAARDARP